jgi:putative ABC transport system permease protein
MTSARDSGRMSFLALLEEALVAMSSNRLRSGLTMLGIVIGVASVILMLAIGEGSRQRVAASISSLGSNQLIVTSGASSQGGFRGAAGTLPTLTLGDAEAMADLVTVRAVAPVSNIPVQVVFGSRNVATLVTGTTPPYFPVNSMSLSAGLPFDDADVRRAANVAVLGATVVRELFGDTSPLGQTIRIQRQVFDVIGVLSAKGQGFGGQDQDDVILLPITTAQRKLAGSVFPGTVGMILVESAQPDAKADAIEEVAQLLRQRHRISPGQSDDFSIRDMSSISSTLQLTSTILSVLLGSIALISLLVGGIGIMNIMLVSVTERTREIGLRMAIGARRASVLGQFLMEAVLLSVTGAIAGVALGLLSGWLVAMTGVLQPVYSVGAVIMAFTVAVVVGVVFGLWPARQAARLEPVEALRQQ